MTTVRHAGRVLAVGTVDATHEAGVQADIQTVAALGGHAAIAVAALTARDPSGARTVLDVPPAFLRAQLTTLLAAGSVDAFKTGMLGDAARIEAVAAVFAQFGGIPYVLDPTMVATGGHAALPSDALATLKRVLVPLATVITPDVDEAEALSGVAVETLDDMRRVAEMLLTLGAPAILLRGRDFGEGQVTDVLATDEGCELFTSDRAAVRRHSSCVLASALATGLARGFPLRDAVVRARAHVEASTCAGTEHRWHEAVR